MPRTKIGKTSQEIKSVLKKPIKKNNNDSVSSFLLFPGGCTLLNLACSDSIQGAFKLGTIVTIPGSSGAGKTMLVVTALAVAFYSNKFKNYRLFYDDGEEALSFNMNKLFGMGFNSFLNLPPLGTSETIQHFESNIMMLRKKNKPIIYVLDSLDSLASDEELEKEMRKALAMAKSKEAAAKIAGSFGAEKAKIIGRVLRMADNFIKQTNSILIIIQQKRQRMNAGPFSSPWVTSGGEAPFFYSSHQIWLDKKGKLETRKREIGTKVKASIKKNRLTGKLRKIEFDIYTEYGVDDLGSMISFMIEEGYWKKRDSVIYTNWEGIEGTPSEIVKQIEKNQLGKELQKEVGEAWNEIEDSLTLDRIPRF